MNTKVIRMLTSLLPLRMSLASIMIMRFTRLDGQKRPGNKVCPEQSD
jgi:hypothetical protein